MKTILFLRAKRSSVLPLFLLLPLLIAYCLTPNAAFSSEATPGYHESKGLMKTFTWSAKSHSSTGKYDSGESVYTTDTAGASTYVTGYLYAIQVISSTGASAFASE